MRDVAATTQMDPAQLRGLLEAERPTQRIRTPAWPREWTVVRLVITATALLFAIGATLFTLF